MHYTLYESYAQHIYNRKHIKCSMHTTDELRKNVSFDESTWKRLKTYGAFGESFDELVNKLLNELDDFRRKTQSKK